MSAVPSPTRVLCIFGTRPEVIKMAPVVRALRAHPADFAVTTCLTAQHRTLVDPLLSFFQIAPDFDLDVMQEDQSLSGLTAGLFKSIDALLERQMPEWVIVQGDTTSAMVGAMAGFYRRTRVAHVEAGLRTGHLDQPFPEELNRIVISRVADLHFAPTDRARQNLRAEGIAASAIHVTGNTAVDSVQWSVPRIQASAQDSLMSRDRRLVFVTLHRRESFGRILENMCGAIREIAASLGDGTQFLWPLHPNPSVAPTVRKILGDLGNVTLSEPFDYPTTLSVLRRCYCVVTDSGGLQEEAPSFGKPVLVLRDTTERPEGIEAGVAMLVGTSPTQITTALTTILDEARYRQMVATTNPYGDGMAATRIVDILRAHRDLH